MSRILDEEVVFATPWFAVEARRVEGEAEPYYALVTADYVSVLALTPEREVLLVEQFRPAVGARTLELPSGNVDPGETPAAAAQRELLEETGYAAGELIPLGTLLPDTGRLANRVWGYLVLDAEPVSAAPELTVIRRSLGPFLEAVVAGEMNHGLHVALVGLALLKGLLPRP